jgi:hypothetical protein
MKTWKLFQTDENWFKLEIEKLILKI